MADNAKAKSAKERLEAAKRSAEEAEILDQTTVGKAADSSESSAPEATAAADTENAAQPSDGAEPVKADGAALDETDGEKTPEEVAAADDGAVKDDGAADEAPEEASAAKDGAATDDMAADHPPEAAPAEEPTIRREPDPAPQTTEEASGSLAATILKFLVILFVGGAVALWAGPKIAPNLPGWAAPVATFLTPGANDAAERIDAVAAQNREQSEALSSQIEAAAASAAAADQKAAEAGAAVEQARADLSAAIAEVAEEPRADLERMNDLATRLVTAEATVEGLRAEIDALGGISADDAAPSAEVLERVAAFGASVEGLRAEIASLKTRTAQIEALAKSEDLAALADRVAALEEGEAATAGARDEASDIRRSANISAAMTRIEQALLSGAPYAPALADVTSLSGESAPPVLSEAAAAGLPTQESLTNSFPVAAQAAYAAALEENAGEGFAGGVLAKLQGRLGGRPSIETEGDDAGAVLSRVEARLKEGRLADARAEADGLSETARAAMAGWLANLSRAADGAAAFATYRNAVTTN